MLDESVSSLKQSMGLVESRASQSNEQADSVYEQLNQLEAKLSVLSEQYSGTTESFSAHMVQNTEIVAELMNKIEFCKASAGEILTTKNGLQSLQSRLGDLEQAAQDNAIQEMARQVRAMLHTAA